MTRSPLTALCTLVALAGTAEAQTVTTAGDFELAIEGEVYFAAEYADEDLGLEPAAPGREYFFNQSVELGIEASRRDTATGVRYGAYVEVENDGTNAEFDVAYLFAEGAFGELILGDEDDINDNDDFAFNASTVAAGSGGVDGDQRAAPEFIVGDSATATKILYYSPRFLGFAGAASFALNEGDRGEAAAPKSGNAEDIVNVALNWEGTLGGVGLGAYGGVIGADADDGRATNWVVGGKVDAFGLAFAGQYADEDPAFSADELGGDARDDFFNVGVGGQWRNIDLSFNFQRDDYVGDTDKLTYIAGATAPLLPGVTLRGDATWQTREIDGDDRDGLNLYLQLRTVF